MKNTSKSNALIFLFKQFLFWILFFFVVRTIFLVANINKISSESIIHIGRAYYEGLYIDISTSSYILIFSFLFTILYIIFNKKYIITINLFYVSAVIIIVLLIIYSELSLYNEWGIKLHYKALRFLQNPSEIIQTAGTKILTYSILAILLTSVVSIVVFKKYFSVPIIFKEKKYFSILTLLLIIPPLLALGIRGGWQQIPIQLSDVYYSHNNTLNNVAVNSLWNIGHSIRENINYISSNPYQITSIKKAQTTVDSLFHVKKDSSLQILNNNKPNIVLFILEGWSADLIASLNGYHGVTPHFDSLAKKGILFSNIYASGDRSDQGMAAILSGFPAQPTTSIISQPSKYSTLPCLGKTLKTLGYTTSFVFGGQLTYGNIKSYIVYNNFDILMEGKDFPDELHLSKLGVPDEFVYKEKLNISTDLQEPFFSASFNISSHAPYDIPVKYAHKWGNNENGYINSVWYADSCLGIFMEQAKKQKWYKNTLFIFIPDHSHNSPRNHNFYSPAYRKIPLLFFGEVIDTSFWGKEITKLGSQTDLAATILYQLKTNFSEYSFSKNLLNNASKDFAYYAIVDGLGWIKPEGYFIYDYPLKRYYETNIDSANKDALINEGKYYLQHVFQTYQAK